MVLNSNTIETLSKHHQTLLCTDFVFKTLKKKKKKKKNGNTRKNLNASYVALWKLDLNELKDFERLVLYRSCVIYSN